MTRALEHPPNVSFPQADDFRSECDALRDVLEPLDDEAFERVTQFKGWTLHDVVAHLHLFNVGADHSIHRAEQWIELWQWIGKRRQAGDNLLQLTDLWLDQQCDGARRRAVFEIWRDFYPSMCDRLAEVDPRQRVPWAGPSMSVRSSISARQMETWAHGQEVFDALGLERPETDRIRNVAILGVNTFGWTFRVRGQEPPGPRPEIELTAPSGARWHWPCEADGDQATGDLVRGQATDFCQVVTQVRNVLDTRLEVVGEVARAWMDQAQCFAGGAESPPPPGTRFREVKG